MITRKKIELFKKFSGDIDHLLRVGTDKEKSDISDTDWGLINSLLQDLELVDKGLAADSFVKNLDIRLKENLESEAILEDLKSITRKQ